MKPEDIFLLGIALIFLGIFLTVLSSYLLAKQEKTKVEVAVGGFVGPIPFGFATSREAYYMLILLLIFSLLFFLLILK